MLVEREENGSKLEWKGRHRSKTKAKERAEIVQQREALQGEGVPMEATTRIANQIDQL